MAYQTYTTDALVIGSKNRLTADRMVALFTREAGLVYARAVSVRREQSKLRYGLQDFSLSRVSLVRGKQGWRITGAECEGNLYFAANNRRSRGALLRTLKLVHRLVRGEETHVALYDLLLDGLMELTLGQESEIVRGERILSLRILSALGYVSPKETYRQVLMAPSLRAALSCQTDSISEEKEVKFAIDTALLSSQL
ncbi:MAG: recombination protein O N-terminal domain-containing protein [Patescibacteria group bacterium]|nr:recombination protein O N-terminal domain-containing protein [Patescibacteria group bacterium]